MPLAFRPLLSSMSKMKGKERIRRPGRTTSPHVVGWSQWLQNYKGLFKTNCPRIGKTGQVAINQLWDFFWHQKIAKWNQNQNPASWSAKMLNHGFVQVEGSDSFSHHGARRARHHQSYPTPLFQLILALQKTDHPIVVAMIGLNFGQGKVLKVHHVVPPWKLLP